MVKRGGGRGRGYDKTFKRGGAQWNVQESAGMELKGVEEEVVERTKFIQLAKNSEGVTVALDARCGGAKRAERRHNRLKEEPEKIPKDLL